MKKYISLAFFIYACSISFAYTFNAESDGSLSFEFRKFSEDENKAGLESNQSIKSSLRSKGSYYSFNYVLEGFTRFDENDSARSYIVLEDFYLSRYLGENEAYIITAGYRIYNWSVMDVLSSMDIINSRIYDGQLESKEKKGELSLEVSRDFESGSVSFYYWPKFTSPILPSRDSRLGIDFKRAQEEIMDDGESSSHEWITQYGVRGSFSIGAFDLAAHYVNHIDRLMPLYAVNLNLLFPENSTLSPIYYRITDIGLSSQYSIGSFILKFEGDYRYYHDDVEVNLLSSESLNTVVTSAPKDHYDLSFGIEYSATVFSGHSLSLLGEYKKIEGPDKEDRERLSIFQNDLMLGARYSFNDAMSSEASVFLITDLERENERIYMTSFTRRLTDEWKYKFALNFYDAPVKGVSPIGAEQLHNDHFLEFNLVRFF